MCGVFNIIDDPNKLEPKIKRSNAPPLLNKPVFSGFTKKSKFGPSFSTMPGT